jgi:trans-aconitate methyltransferase
LFTAMSFNHSHFNHSHFNHNDFYHPFLLRKVPVGCHRALDVGCGTGTFARLLARHAAEVDAIDRSAEMIAAAEPAANVSFRHADLHDLELPAGHYDFVSCIAAIHHMPFADTVMRLREALAPRGVLAILGLNRPTMADLLLSVAAFAPNSARMALNRARRVPAGVPTPVMDPRLTLAEIRAQARDLLPGAQLRRHLYWRYSLVYRKPTG